MGNLYCGNHDCGEYLGSLGADSCSVCGWAAPVDTVAIESEATAPLLARIAELEQANEAFAARQEWWNSRMFELEQKVAELEADAKRLGHIYQNLDDDGAAWWLPEICIKEPAGSYPTREEFNAVLDAAMKEQP